MILRKEEWGLNSRTYVPLDICILQGKCCKSSFHLENLETIEGGKLFREGNYLWNCWVVSVFQGFLQTQIFKAKAKKGFKNSLPTGGSNTTI